MEKEIFVTSAEIFVTSEEVFITPEIFFYLNLLSNVMGGAKTFIN